MKNKGKARKAAIKLIVIAAILLALVLLAGLVALIAGTFIMGISIFLISLWILFVFFTLFFFRDPSPRVPVGAGLVVSPGHGKVDVIDTVNEPAFMGGECRRVSIFLSVFNVHVQNAPVGGRIGFLKYTEGQFMNALKTECAACNENVYIGFNAVDPAALKIGVRLIAGAIARRIEPFVQAGEEVARGDRISLIQFGSRVDVYLPLSCNVSVKLGDKVVGGETILATLN